MDLPKWLYLTCKRGDIKPYLRQKSTNLSISGMLGIRED